MKYYALILLCFVFGCSRPPIEKLTTTISAQSPPDQNGKTILYACDIDVTVNNMDGTIVIRYFNFSPWFARQHSSTLEKRAEIVIEQYFPHLGDITIQKNNSVYEK
jgi:hypothetical protein